jgi:transcriptional regulator with XRE-family HTH domain
MQRAVGRPPHDPGQPVSGEAIRRLRRERGLSRAALGELVGVSERTVLRWESGESLPSRAHLRALALALRTRPAALA